MRARLPLVLALVLGAGVARGQSDTSKSGDSPEPKDSSSAAAEPVPAAPVHAGHTYSLKECLGFAEKNYPNIHEAPAQLARMRGQLWEAKTAPYSQFTATAGVVLAPTLSGTALYSPNTDATITSSMALA